MAVKTRVSLIAGVLAALGASACCAGPLILLLLGIGGGWAAHMVALEPYSPYFTGLTLLFMGAAFFNLYVRPHACAPSAACAADRVRKNQRRLFWAIAVSVTLLLTLPWFASIFY